MKLKEETQLEKEIDERESSNLGEVTFKENEYNRKGWVYFSSKSESERQNELQESK